jgi:hypothetical protein
MTEDPRLGELLLDWQEWYAQGRDVPADELCRACPELTGELGRRIAVLRHLGGLAHQVGGGGVGPAEPCPAAAGTDPWDARESGADWASSGTDLAAWLRSVAPPQQPGELGRLGQFAIRRLLGRGGMGAVFEAEDPALERRVALKVMRPAVAAHPEAKARFLREARAAAALQHDHIVPVFHVGEHNGVPFMVMPLLAGESLEDRLRREAPLAAAEVARVGREAAAGLAAAHAAGLVHRDVKPANLWLEAPAGRVKVLDFGLARVADVGGGGLTQTGAVLGTPSYMSPEQADGRPVDGRSDLFSLGCVLYRLATGEPPFPGTTLTAVLRAVAEHHPPPPRDRRPDLPAALSDLIERLLAKDPDRRPASARAVADELQSLKPVGEGEPVVRAGTAGPPADRPRRRRWSRTIRWPVSITLSLALLVTLALGAPALWRWFSGRLAVPGARPALRGVIDLRVWRTGPGGAAARRRLSDPGALPLQPGDQFRIAATADRAAYLYLFWIDTEGQAVPVYPWQPGRWGTRPAEERRVAELELPPTAAKGYTISGARPGMETLILVARPERLALPDEQIQGWFAGLPAQRPYQNPESAVWFENGRIVTGDDSRRPRGFEETDIADPVLRVQGLLKERIGPHAAGTAAVSFARLGKGGMP